MHVLTGWSDMGDRQEFDRTELAEDRTIMAVERTFAGWIRTSFAAIGIGLAFKVLFGELDPPWLARAIATIFILLAAFLSIAAERRACRAMERMRSHSVDSPRAPHLRYVAWAVAAGSLVLAVAIWLMRDVAVPLVG
ncbi:hypothetical protein GCM10010989_13000 [Croceicoccus pelagius]|uniref:DUF202 domain-containing protein n=2 Tax=Croceicoccus pelagius TaxID=1703341 RepID=A0A917DIJ3_9SPHN|nr:hypothetical protein GCM10010989_13000 [Croceicoccus pelagius]